MSTPYEVVTRLKKAMALADVIHAESISSDLVMDFDDDCWRAAAEKAGVRPPSMATQIIVFKILRKMEWGPSPILDRGDAAGLRRVGKKAAGRLLDGREWNEMPEEHDSYKQAMRERFIRAWNAHWL